MLTHPTLNLFAMSIPISNIRKKKLNFDKNFADDVKHEDISWGGG